MTDLSSTLHVGTSADIDACVELWVAACAARDGRAIAGVAERARPKFERIEAWTIAESPAQTMSGFVLATPPRSGLPTDPPDAPVVSLLAVDPAAQGAGTGSRLLSSISNELAARGHDEAILHVLVDNVAAVGLYESCGWVALGNPFEHSLLKRPFQTYARNLRTLVR